jgi:V8-like Glu-specific endopeptidase
LKIENKNENKFLFQRIKNSLIFIVLLSFTDPNLTHYCSLDQLLSTKNQKHFSLIMTIKLFALFCALVVSVNSQFQCGISRSKTKGQEDVNSKGQLTEDGQWPWAAALYLKDGNHRQYLCSGTLISDQYVLTGKWDDIRTVVDNLCATAR